MKKELELNINLKMHNAKLNVGAEKNSIGNVIYYVTKIINKFTKLKSSKEFLDKYPIKGEYNPQKTLEGWYQCKEIGCLLDKEDNEKRELL